MIYAAYTQLWRAGCLTVFVNVASDSKTLVKPKHGRVKAVPRELEWACECP